MYYELTLLLNIGTLLRIMALESKLPIIKPVSDIDVNNLNLWIKGILLVFREINRCFAITCLFKWYINLGAGVAFLFSGVLLQDHMYIKGTSTSKLQEYTLLAEVQPAFLVVTYQSRWHSGLDLHPVGVVIF